MAPKKKATDISDDFPDLAGSEPALDAAIDDLRGVLKADADGGLPDLGGDFGSEFSADGDAPSFGGDFGSEFGGGDLGGGGFGGSADFGGEDRAPGSALTANMDLIMDIPVEVQIVLGTSRMQVAGLMGLTEGSTIALDRKIGEPVEIIVNGRLIGLGEITVLESDDTRFGVKLTEIKSTQKR
jgi:flagellar motor switch protein FliN